MKLLLKLNKLTTDLNDDELEQLISITQQSMLAELGITLDPVHHVFTVYPNYTEPRKQTRVPITLPLVNVVSIDKILINGVKLVEDVDYFFDENNSIIYLTPRFKNGSWYWNWMWSAVLCVKINYTTQFDDDIIFDLLRSLLNDLLIYQQTPDMQKNVESVKEGDVTVSFNTDKSTSYSLPKRIQDKKDSILSLLNNTRVMMI